MKKYISILFLSIFIGLFLMISSQQSFNLVTNKNFLEIEKNKSPIFFLTNANDEYSKMRLLHINKQEKCTIKTNKISFKDKSVEIWEINCEK